MKGNTPRVIQDELNTLADCLLEMGKIPTNEWRNVHKEQLQQLAAVARRLGERMWIVEKK
jgi:hypothetical protein